MKICLVGGIYNKGGARSNYLKITPETTLETGFRFRSPKILIDPNTRSIFDT